MKPLSAVFLFLFLQLSPAAVANEMTLEIIPLKHRLVDDVVPILRPLLVPGGSITGMNNQLIINSTPGNIAELKNVLENIDHSPRKLLITVKQDAGFSTDNREQSVAGRYSTGDVTITNRDGPRHRDGLIISGRDEDGNIIRYRLRDSEANHDEQHSFRVQTVEGSPAFIQVGQSVPIHNRTRYYTPHGVYETETHEYYDASSGLYVLPRLSGDQVTLLAAPRLTRKEPGKHPVFDVQNVQTTARGKLGEWIRLSGINQDFNESDRELLSSSDSQGSRTGAVWIRVDEIE